MRNYIKNFILTAGILCCIPCTIFAATLPSLDLTSAQGYPGDTVTIGITLTNPSAEAIGGTQNDIKYNPSVITALTPTARLGPSGKMAGKDLTLSDIFESNNTATFTIGVFGMNTDVIPDGEVASIGFQILENTPPGTYTLKNTPYAGGSGSKPDTMRILGYPIEVTGTYGTITVLSRVTTSTTTSTSGGGGGGGGSYSTTTTLVAVTTSVAATTSTTAIPVTTTSTTTTIPECLNDGDCDDGSFCNGKETCVDGICVAGQSPCGEGQVCGDDTDECRATVELTAFCLPATARRPFLFPQRCTWLLLNSAGKNNFSENSVIAFSSPSGEAAGLKVNPDRKPFALGNFIFLPVCIQKDAATGPVTLTIRSEAHTSNTTVEETIETSFTVK